MKMSRASSLARPHGTNLVFAKARFRREGQSSSEVVFGGAHKVVHAPGTTLWKSPAPTAPGGVRCSTW
jgi:hypothetical protein